MWLVLGTSGAEVPLGVGDVDSRYLEVLLRYSAHPDINPHT